MEKERYLKNIELVGADKFKFSHKDTQSTFCFKWGHSFDTFSLEAITFHNNKIGFHDFAGVNTEFLDATIEDFEELKRVITQSPKFVECGKDNVFVVEKVVGFSKGQEKNTIIVDCRSDEYIVKLQSKKEAIKLIKAVQKRWQKMFTAWDQNRDSGQADEDDLHI